MPSVCLGCIKIAGFEFNRPREPSGTMHPWVNANEQARLEMNAKHYRDLLPAKIEIELVAADRSRFRIRSGSGAYQSAFQHVETCLP
jgi:hypothetical protein